MNIIKYTLSVIGLILLLISCSDDDPMVTPMLPEASYSFTQNELSVNFTNSSANADSYAWDFGDGNSSTAPSPSHTYSTEGTYDVELSVSNAYGNSSVTKSITVSMEFVAPDLGYILAFKGTGDVESEFILTVDDLMNGEINAIGQGIEQTGWRFYYPASNTLFASGYSEDNQCAGYQNDQMGGLEKVGEFIFENALEMFGSSDETLLAMEIPRAGFDQRRLHFVDANTSFVTKIVGTTIYVNTTDSLVAWPTALKVRGNQLFVPFHKLDAKGFFTTPDANSAFVAVYDYPNVGAEPVKIISDSRTSNIGVNGTTTGLIESDNGDLYSFSCGAEMAGFAPAATVPSGVLKIPSGSDDFDPNYFFNIESATGGGKIFWMDYLGNGKAIARILIDDNGGPWAAYGRDVFNQKLVILDLESQTVTDIADIPLHAKRYTSPIFVEDGKVYVSIETANDVHIYQVDINTAIGVKGAKVNGKTIKGIFKL